MALKRKRQTNHDNVELGSPSKKHKSLSLKLNDIELTPSKQAQHKFLQKSPILINKHRMNLNNVNQDNDMDGDDEHDSDLNLTSSINVSNKNKIRKRNKKKRRQSITNKHPPDIDNNDSLILTPTKKLQFANLLCITQSMCPSTDDPANTTANESPISNIAKINNKTISPLQNNGNISPSKQQKPSLILTSSPQQLRNHNNSAILQSLPLNESICINPIISPPNIKAEQIKIAKQRNIDHRFKRQNASFWRQIDKLDLIVPPPDDDLCDRHLVITHIDTNEQKDESNEDEQELESNRDSEIIHGLDSDDSMEFGLNEQDKYKSVLLPNTKLSPTSLQLLDSMSIYQYRIIKIANFALGIKSPYFRNLLSKKSVFAESKQDLIQIKVDPNYAFTFELMIRLLHLNEQELDQYLLHIQNHRTLLQLLILIDQYQIQHITSSILKRLKFLASRPRPNPIDERAIRTNSKSVQIRKKRKHALDHCQNLNDYHTDSDKENINQDDSQKILTKRCIEPRGHRDLDHILKSIRNSSDDDSYNAMPKNHDICHILPGFDPSFDNGGMSLFEVSDLLVISDKYLCLCKCRDIAKHALRKRYRQLKFNPLGVIDSDFRKLPAAAINIILKANDFCSWNENDVFLACAQWAADPVTHENDDNEAPKNNKPNKYGKKSQHNARNRHIVCTRFDKIWENIRFHYLDRWFIEAVVKHYYPIKSNNKALSKLLNVSTKASLVENLAKCPRFKDINKFFREEKSVRPIPSNSVNRKKHEVIFGDHLGEWETFSMRYLSPTDLIRKHDEYDTFEILFDKSELEIMDIGQRITSRYVVWHGIIFALDLVRKNHRDRNRDSVGVFLYCQGLECGNGHIWIRYALKSEIGQHTLQCSDYKMMELNFQKGNGSRDFFGCSWSSFLQTYFNQNDKLKFILTFLEIK